MSTGTICFTYSCSSSLSLSVRMEGNPAHWIQCLFSFTSLFSWQLTIRKCVFFFISTKKGEWKGSVKYDGQ